MTKIPFKAHYKNAPDKNQSGSFITGFYEVLLTSDKNSRTLIQLIRTGEEEYQVLIPGSQLVFYPSDIHHWGERIELV